MFTATTSGRPSSNSCNVSGNMRERFLASTTCTSTSAPPFSRKRRTTRCSSVVLVSEYMPGVSRTSKCRPSTEPVPRAISTDVPG
jgi:hypothetical protein